MFLLIKRGVDFIVALGAIVLLSPFMLILMLLIRWKLGTPVFFVQERPGFHGRIFKMIKFRTMTDACDSAGMPLPDERRMTAFGNLLRKTSLDELPELFNILRGEMSLVGPRPLLVEYLSLYTPEQNRRHDVRPGLTGYAQVNGRNAISWEKRFELDVYYVDHWSLRLDAEILWATVLTVLGRQGVSAGDHVTMPRFRGSNRDDS